MTRFFLGVLIALCLLLSGCHLAAAGAYCDGPVYDYVPPAPCHYVPPPPPPPVYYGPPCGY